MAAIDFPNSPAVNDIHTVGSKSWQWDGITWNLLSTVVVNSLTGTASQILVGGTSGTAQSGALTLTLPTDVTISGVLQGSRLTSTVATGTAPLSVTSTTAVTNLNADLLDGIHSTGFARHFTSGQIIAHGSFTSAAFSGTPATVGGTNGIAFNFGVTFGATPTLLLTCSALTGNTTTVVNVGTTLSTTQGSYRAALVAGTSTSTVTIHWVAIGTA
jgi:hypothetical protein